MKFDRVIIKNFRSIDDLIINFDRNFQVLVGINESGKSNIIKAISLIGEEYNSDVNDIRDINHNENPISESYVRFIFSLENDDSKYVVDKVKEVICAKNINDIICKKGGKEYTVIELCNIVKECLYNVDVLNGKKNYACWSLDQKGYIIAGNWKKVLCKEGEFKISCNDGVLSDLSVYKIINTNGYRDIPDSTIGQLSFSDIISIIQGVVRDLLKDVIPNCLLWDYDSANLLPGKIDLSKFMEDPDSCIPLKNMFSLAGYVEIVAQLKEQSKRKNGITNTLNKVADNTTSHLKKVWPEWDELSVSLAVNGDYIDAGVKDKYNVYSVDRRSDGFKRFFTFLLMLSAQNQTKDIYNNIILMDEPDIGLHPSGVQYLRDELIKIGLNNIVLISTHSIFMIDREITDRHLIVKKEKEITSLSRVGSSNITDEEVVLKALGYSLYELLKPTNIIFEGWRDKRIFEMFMRSKLGVSVLPIKKQNTIGYLHAVGVKNIPDIANTCENFGRKYIIISDSDNPAKEKKSKFDGVGEWVLYTDINGVKSITTEDFICNNLLNKAIFHVLSSKTISYPIIIPSDMISNKLLYIENEIKKFESNKDSIRKLLNDIKEYISLNAKAADLNDDYCKVCSAIISKITAIS